MMKKILSLLICVSLCMSMTAMQSFAEEAAVPQAQYGREYDVINALFDTEGIFGEASSPATRMQFVKAVCTMLGYIYTDGAAVSFTDVDASTAEYDILKSAVNAGLISDSATFRPDEAITISEALKVCAVPAGYAPKAEMTGGYPSGYYKMAKELDILDGMSDITGAMTADDAYRLLYNLINANMVEIVKIGSDAVEYAVNTTETVLSVNKGIKRAEGIMNANEYTKLGANDAEGTNGTVEINGTVYRTELDFNHSLGYKVHVYYTEDRGIRQVKYIDDAETEIFRLESLDGCTYSDNVLTYYKDDSSKKYTEKLDPSFEYIYNGKPYYSYTKADFVPVNGSLTLGDTDDDGKYDLVIADDYYYMQVLAIDMPGKIITSKYNTSERLILADDDVRYTVYSMETAAPADLSAVSNDAVLAVKCSKDRKLIEIVVCDTYIEGVVTEVSTTDGEMGVDGVLYEVSDEFAAGDMQKITAGMEVSAYLGLHGEIVFAEEGTSGYNYGFAVAADRGGALEKEFKLKIFTKAGEFKIYKLAEKIRLDGDSGKNHDTVYSALAEDSAFKAQLIRYKASDDIITGIDTARDTDDLLDSVNDSADDSLRRYNVGSSFNYRNNVFWPAFNISGTTVFKIPEDLDDEENFTVGGSFGDETHSGIEAYDISMGGTAGAVVKRMSADDTELAFTSLYSSATYILVDKVVSALDDEGEIVRMIRGWSAGSFGSWYVDEDVTITKKGVAAQLVKGDLIRAKVKDGVIKLIAVDFDAAKLDVCDLNTARLNPTSHSYSLGYQVGKVYSTGGGYAYLSSYTKRDDSGEYVYDDMRKLINVKLPTNMVVYNLTTGEMKPATADMIKTYLGSGDDAAFMIVLQHYLASQQAVIYER